MTIANLRKLRREREMLLLNLGLNKPLGTCVESQELFLKDTENISSTQTDNTKPKLYFTEAKPATQRPQIFNCSEGNCAKKKKNLLRNATGDLGYLWKIVKDIGFKTLKISLS